MPCKVTDTSSPVFEKKGGKGKWTTGLINENWDHRGFSWMSTGHFMKVKMFLMWTSCSASILSYIFVGFLESPSVNSIQPHPAERRLQLWHMVKRNTNRTKVSCSFHVLREITWQFYDRQWSIFVLIVVLENSNER